MLGRLLIMQYINEGEKAEPDASKPFIKITTCEGATPFDKDKQVGRDSIDLRTGNEGYKIKRDYEYISTLDEKIEECFQKIQLSTEHGYIIDPGETIVVGSAERIKLSGPLFGEVMGRTRYARMGLSVHCTAPKFQGYSDAIIAFQITNHNLVPLKIFPYQTIAQLVIHDIQAYPQDVDGRYYNENVPFFPSIDEKELSGYNKQDVARIRKNASKKSDSRDSNGVIRYNSQLYKRIKDLIIGIDIVILAIVIGGSWVSKDYPFLCIALSSILTVLSGVLTFINKRENE